MSEVNVRFGGRCRESKHIMAEFRGAYNDESWARLEGSVPERLLSFKFLRDAMQKGGHASERWVTLALWPEGCTCEGRGTK